MIKSIKYVNNSDDKGLFKAFIPMMTGKDGKVEVFEKTLQNGKKVKYLVGEGSNTKVDKAYERVAKSFIQKMATSIKGLNVFVEHEHHINNTIGFIEKAEMGDNDNLLVTTALENEDDNEMVKSILKKIDHGTKIFYSISGRITKAAKNYDDEIKNTVKELIDGDIYELSLTALPEGNVDFVQPLHKSLRDFVNYSEKHKENIIEEESGDNVSTEQFIKTLDEMVQSSDLQNQIYEIYSAFRSAIYEITNNDNLAPAHKKEKIISIAAEYGTKVETMASQLATLLETIQIDLGIGNSNDNSNKFNNKKSEEQMNKKIDPVEISKTLSDGLKSIVDEALGKLEDENVEKSKDKKTVVINLDAEKLAEALSKKLNGSDNNVGDDDNNVGDDDDDDDDEDEEDDDYKFMNEKELKVECTAKGLKVYSKHTEKDLRKKLRDNDVVLAAAAKAAPDENSEGDEETEKSLEGKQKLFQKSIDDTVKSLGLDPKTVKVDFKVVSKKKSVVKSDGDEEEKFDTEEFGDLSISANLEKAMNSLSDEDKNEVFNSYMKEKILK